MKSIQTVKTENILFTISSGLSIPNWILVTSLKGALESNIFELSALFNVRQLMQTRTTKRSVID